MMTPEHHALVLAYLVREILNHFGKQSGDLVSKAICEYGEQRGKRMAGQAAADNRKNDLKGFLLYGEIDWDDTGNQFEIVHRKPFFKMRAAKCFWHDIWSRNNMAEAGS